MEHMYLYLIIHFNLYISPTHNVLCLYNTPTNT